MADPLTILGAAAASSQLIQQGYMITKFFVEVYSDIRSAPEVISGRLREIEHLIAVSKLIRVTPALDRNEVVIALNTCRNKAAELHLKLTESLSSDEDKRWQRLKRSFTFVMQKKDIINLFDDLEREKSSLILCIQAIQPGILANIQDEVRQVQEGLIELAKDVSTINTELPVISGGIENIAEKVVVMHDTMLPNLMQQLQVQRDTIRKAQAQVGGTYGVPNRLARDFVGREDILTKLHQTIPALQSMRPRIVVIRGIGGQGKTQLALEFCDCAVWKHQFNAVLWVDASSEVTTKTSFESFYNKMNSHEIGFLETDAKVESVRNTVASLEKPWLMVFDNYDDPISFQSLQDFFPNHGRGMILITTRHSDTDRLADEDSFIELLGLEPTDGVRLLIKQCRIPPSDETHHDALGIVERLGNHALAIVQAGTYIWNKKIRLDQFMEHFNRRKELILETTPRISHYRRKLNNDEKETSLSVFATWELSFQQLEAEDPDGRKGRLLTLLAFFDGKEISEKLLQAYCDDRYLTRSELEILGGCVNRGRHSTHENDDILKSIQSKSEDNLWEDEKKSENENKDDTVYHWDSDVFSDVLNELRAFCLIEKFHSLDDGWFHVALHPLVNDWIKMRIKDPDDRYKCYKLSVDILRYIIENSEDVHSREAALPHLDAIQRNFQEFPDIRDRMYSDVSTIETCEGFANFLWKAGKYRETIPWDRLSVKISTEKYGPRSEQTLRALRELADALQELGEYDEAMEIAKRLINVAAEAPNPNKDVNALNTLAACFAREGNYGEAENIYESIIKYIEQGHRTNNMGTFLNNYGWTLSLAGKEEAAERIKKRARDVQNSLYGPLHRVSIESDNNYAMTLQALGRTDEAEKIALDVLKRSQDVFGSDHPSTIEHIDTLGQVYFAQGKYIAAEKFCLQALLWRETNFGLKHFKTLESQSVMANLQAAKTAYENQ